ncbi:uncharacterized protein LOC107273408 isoform X2 [Cephus cinctus]|nr:uncharacterized protein LOC107273408 isoform X2 [Cephus cinctus]XP_024946491.1 uncharacterized protein LOC107273408 isoform X2 [Cephus cinctus]XP_024946492.1 uncharacterized protein LOC107273408 isoform X2 [Cephus cinctus]
MLSYMLPTDDKPPPGNNNPNYHLEKLSSQRSVLVQASSPTKIVESSKAMIGTIASRIDDSRDHVELQNQNGSLVESPKYNGTTATRKSTLHSSSRVVKDDSLYSIGSDASTVGSEKKHKILNGAKHASLKRVSFGSSKGSMVETLVYETPVQEEPEMNHFLEHNGRLPAPMIPVPDTDEGRERVRVSLLEPAPSPATPGVLLLEPVIPPGHLVDAMATSPAELLTTHTDHTTPTYHTQISTDSGWDNPFRPDGDLSREADEIVELIKGGKPITPTPGQNAPPLPGCEASSKTPSGENDSSSSPLLKSGANATPAQQANSSPRINQGNGNAHSTPVKANASVNSQQPVNEKVGSATNAATVEVGRVTAQGPGDASQVEHVTLKKKPKCKCCVLQ